MKAHRLRLPVLQQTAALAEGGQQLIELVAAQGRGAFIVRAQRDRRLFAIGGGRETRAEQLGECRRQLTLIQRRRQFSQAAGIAG